MHSRGAVNENLAVGMFQGSKRELYTALEKIRRLELEIVVSRIPQDADAVGHAEVAIVELNLHVNDVGYTLVHHFDHLHFIPDAPTDRKTIGNPRHIHIASLQHGKNVALVTDGFVHKHDGNVVDDGINKIAPVAAQTSLVGSKLHWLFT
jgi:hypothetical protein